MMYEFLKPVLIGGAFIAAASLFSGAVTPWDDGRDAVLVEEIYVVRPGDTVWGIAERYIVKNTVNCLRESRSSVKSWQRRRKRGI